MVEPQNSATALVTGAALRLGRAIALDLAKHGWQIGVHHHSSSAEADTLVAEIERLGSKAVALKADLTNDDQLRGLAQSCADALGVPTCLVNNAARFEWDSIDTLDWAGWQAELDVNLRAPIFLTQAFARTLPKDASGCVINMIDQRVWRLTPDFFLLHHRQVGAVDRDAELSLRRSRRASVSMRLALDRCFRIGGKARPISSANAARRCLAAVPRSRTCAAPCASCSTPLR